jgi:hypothetical protein
MRAFEKRVVKKTSGPKRNETKGYKTPWPLVLSDLYLLSDRESNPGPLDLQPGSLTTRPERRSKRL